MGKISQREEPRCFIDFYSRFSFNDFLLRLVANFPLRKKGKISFAALFNAFFFLLRVAFRHVHNIHFTEKRWKSFSHPTRGAGVRQDLCTCWRQFLVLKETRSFLKRGKSFMKILIVFEEAGVVGGEKIHTKPLKKLFYHFSPPQRYIFLSLFKQKYVSLNGFHLHLYNNFGYVVVFSWKIFVFHWCGFVSSSRKGGNC